MHVNDGQVPQFAGRVDPVASRLAREEGTRRIMEFVAASGGGAWLGLTAQGLAAIVRPHDPYGIRPDDDRAGTEERVRDGTRGNHPPKRRGRTRIGVARGLGSHRSARFSRSLKIRK